MNIELVKIKIDKEEYRYKYKKLNYCCDKLRKADNAIYLSEEYPACGYEYTEDEAGSRIPQMMICNVECFTEWGEEYEDCRFYPVKFCPFCGELISVVIVKEEDKSTLLKNIDGLYRKFSRDKRETDSKAEERILQKKINELTDIIDYLYDLKEYTELDDGSYVNNSPLHS